MDLRAIRRAAKANLDPLAWSYYSATADAPASASDAQAWKRLPVVPRVLRGVRKVSTELTLFGDRLDNPILVSPTAGQVFAHPDAEVCTATAAGTCSSLMIYSHSASVGIAEFGSKAQGPWWAQVYLLKDRGRTRDYLQLAKSSGASAIVLTVDGGVPGLGPAFRNSVQARLTAVPGNFPGMSWSRMTSTYASGLTVRSVADVLAASELPVLVKGVLNPIDAGVLVGAGVGGIIVSNHGRRQVNGVISSAAALVPILEAVRERIPVLVDGGIRSGLDVFRALALGAVAVGIGRPVLWGLAADGSDGVVAILNELTQELRQAMGGAGAAALSEITTDLVRIPRSWV